MKVGILKSKIEKKLVDSYKTNKLNENLKVFKKLVLENKRISNLFFMIMFYRRYIIGNFVNRCDYKNMAMITNR